MHPSLVGIHERLLDAALDSLRRANTDAVFFDPHIPHRESLAPLTAGHAGELLMKALIAREHPLLLFKNLLERQPPDEIDLDWLIMNGQTHDFSKLPSLLWAASGINLPHKESFEKLRKIRNQIQHFVPDERDDIGRVCLDFIYLNIDPLLHQQFGLYACLYNEDQFPDHVISCLLGSEIRFSIPPDLKLTEIDPAKEIADSSEEYRKWVMGVPALNG